MKYPETDHQTYRSWVHREWYDLILENLGDLLNFVRVHPIIGLGIGQIRNELFVPFGGSDLFNRRVWLYMNEIEAYNEGDVDEEALAHEWKMSGLERP